MIEKERERESERDMHTYRQRHVFCIIEAQNFIYMAECEVIIYYYCAHFTSTILTLFSMSNKREKKYHPQEVVHQQNL